MPVKGAGIITNEKRVQAGQLILSVTVAGSLATEKRKLKPLITPPLAVNRLSDNI